MSQRGVIAYYTLRMAQHVFAKPPERLDAAERQWLAQSVARQQSLEARVLASREAACVVVPDAQLRSAMDEVQAQYEDSDAFLDELDNYDLSVSQLSDLLERQLRVELVLERQAATVAPVATSEAQHYYASHCDKFLKPERRHAWHLLITLNDAYPENRRAKVAERLERIRRESAGNLARFQRRAERHSECPSALSAGELGWIPRGHLYPALDAALFELAEGEVSPVLETELGLHLVYCNAIAPEQPIPFDEVAESIAAKLTDARRQQAQRAWLRSLA